MKILRRFAPHMLGCLLLLVVGAAVWPALVRGVERVRYTVPSRSPDDGLEGTLLHEAGLVRAGEALYRPLVPDEFVSAPYTPLHTVVLASFGFDQARPFTAGRTISLLALVGVALVIAVFVGVHGRFWWLGLIAALWMLAFAPAQLWGTRIKPDMLALMFTAAGLLVASWRRGRWADWAAVLFALAFFTKQTALIAPFAVGVNLLITDWRRALRYGLIYGLALGLPYLALDIVTERAATAHIWGLHRSEWWRFALFWKYVELLRWSLPLLGLALLGIAAVRTNYAYRQALLYALLAPATMYGAGEIGAHHNHLLETMLAWTMAGGVGAGLVLHGATWKNRRSALAVLAVAGLVWQGWLLRTTPAWYGGEFKPVSRERFATYLQSKSGEVLADDPALVLLAGKPLRFNDPSTMGPAIRSSVWDPSILHAMIENKQWSVILLKVDLRNEDSDAAGRWTDETLALIKQHYQLEFADLLFSYVPKP